jgi:hypothetical protein
MTQAARGKMTHEKTWSKKSCDTVPLKSTFLRSEGDLLKFCLIFSDIYRLNLPEPLP